MVQGAVKKSKVGASLLKSVQKRGKIAAPKKKALVKQQNLQKKLQGKSIQSIEQIMAAKAGAVGKLTIMKKVGEEGQKVLDEQSSKKKRKY